MVTQSMLHVARIGRPCNAQTAVRLSRPGVELSRSTSRSLNRHLEPWRFARRSAPLLAAAQTDRVNGAVPKDSTVLPLDFYTILQVGQRAKLISSAQTQTAPLGDRQYFLHV